VEILVIILIIILVPSLVPTMLPILGPVTGRLELVRCKEGAIPHSMIPESIAVQTGISPGWSSII
jgi:hypothetical protein